MGEFLNERSPQNEEHEPIVNAPPIILGWLAAMFLIHAVPEVFGESVLENFIRFLAFTPSGFIDALQGPISRVFAAMMSLFTYSFLHGDWIHLIVNSLSFLIFATLVARRTGSANFVGLALIVAPIAALTHLAFHWGSPDFVVGASGIVSGMVGASFRFILMGQHQQNTWPPPPLPLLSKPIILVTFVWCALNIVLGITGWTPEGFGRAIAWEAHLGGYFAGMLLFPFFDRRRNWLR